MAVSGGGEPSEDWYRYDVVVSEKEPLEAWCRYDVAALVVWGFLEKPSKVWCRYDAVVVEGEKPLEKYGEEFVGKETSKV